jgi:hypothetical protein
MSSAGEPEIPCAATLAPSFNRPCAATELLVDFFDAMRITPAVTSRKHIGWYQGKLPGGRRHYPFLTSPRWSPLQMDDLLGHVSTGPSHIPEPTPKGRAVAGTLKRTLAAHQGKGSRQPRNWRTPSVLSAAEAEIHLPAGG